VLLTYVDGTRELGNRKCVLLSGGIILAFVSPIIHPAVTCHLAQSQIGRRERERRVATIKTMINLHIFPRVICYRWLLVLPDPDPH
jgi:hypothetical protein